MSKRFKDLTQQERDAFGEEIKALMVNTSEQLLAIADEYDVDRIKTAKCFVCAFFEAVCK